MPALQSVIPRDKKTGNLTERIILAGMGVFLPLLLLIENHINVITFQYADFRIVAAVLAFMFFLLSYFSTFIYKRLDQITTVFLYVLVSHAIFLNYVNDFSYYYASLLMSVVIIAGFYFSSWKDLLAFQASMLLILIQASTLTKSANINVGIFMSFYIFTNCIVFLIQLYIFKNNKVLKVLTERLALTAENLKRTNSSLEQFAYVTSHDLKEPLRTVNSYLQLIQKRYASLLDAEAGEYIAITRDATGRMKDLIDGILKYSKTSAQAMQAQQVDLNEVLENVLENLEISIKENNANIEVHNLPVLQGDKLQLSQLFQNLISNALKYRSKTAPVIQIDHVMQGAHCVICVEDNGLGIPQNEKESVFKIFNRLHTNIADGVGIGLAICKKIVLNHQGEIWVESEEGKGSRFYFSLQVQ